MKGLVFEHDSGAVLKLDEHALAQLLRHTQIDRGAPEAGGVLMGRWLADGLSFVVDEVSEPMPADQRSRTSFFRSAAAHARVVAASMSRSRNTCGYLGEWHTHPEPHPRPSSVDLDDWRKRLRNDRVDLPRVFFVIVGTISVATWTGDRSSKRVEALRLRREA